MKTNTTKKEPLKRKISFYIILIMLPFIILLGLELILRMSGFGRDIPLFIESEQFENYYQPNPDIIQRYFPNPKLAPNVSPDTEYFKKNKPKDSFRIVIQGGSTAAGFPYGRWGSIKGMLDQRFKRLYPDKKIEIINTAMSAVNSYTLLDFVDEIIQQQPDLVLIYAGHNEYLGIMGVGSAFASRGGRAATLMALKFKSIRIYQLIEQLFYSSKNKTIDDSKNRTLMSQIAKEKNIPFDGEMYRAGVEQFSKNLDLILNKYQQHNIPVMISTLVSNERDQAPFSTIDNNAQDAYKLAQKLLNDGEKQQARIYFEKARDLDQLRFRAPSEFNKVIQGIAVKYKAHVIDAEAYFIQNSSDGIPGSELILEHLHPNTKGYFYLAEAFKDGIVENGYLTKSKYTVDLNQALNDIPVSKSDKFYGNYKIKKLTSAYPFTSTPKTVAMPTDNSLETTALTKRLNGESWLSIQQQLLVQYQKQGDFHEAAKIAALIYDAIPEQHQTAYIAGQLYFKIHDVSMAEYYHQRAVDISPQNIQYLLSLAQDLFTATKLKNSLAILNKVLKIDPQHKTALFFSKKIEQQLKGIQP